MIRNIRVFKWRVSMLMRLVAGIGGRGKCPGGKTVGMPAEMSNFAA